MDNEAFKALCRQKLSVFTAKAVTVLEPSIKYKHNWHIDCIAEHLQAVWDGEIQNLIINMPPRSLKTLSTSVSFPAWGFGQDPSIKFMLTSFKPDLASTMTRKTREVITSDWYKGLYPSIELKADQNQKQYFELTGGGHYYSAAMRSVTGTGCDIQICLPYDEVVHTEGGLLKIGDIVEKKENVRVWSMNTKTGKTELKSITGYHKNRASDIVEVSISDGRKIKCTPDHEIWTKNRGMVEAQHLTSSDIIPRPTRFDVVNRHIRNIMFTCYGFVRSGIIKYGQNPFCTELPISNSFFSGAPIFKVACNFAPKPSCPYRENDALANVKPITQNASAFCAFKDFNYLLISKLRSANKLTSSKSPVPFSITNILRPRSKIKVINAIVRSVSIPVAYIMIDWPFSNKSKGNLLVNIKDVSAPVFSRCKSVIPMAISLKFYGVLFKFMPNLAVPRFSFFRNNITKIRNFVNSIISNNGSPLSVSYHSHHPFTYCISVKDNNTFFAGSLQGVLISNCDDPLNPTEAASPAERMNCINTIRGTLFSRFNDPEEGRFILNMQRLNEDDPTGELLKDEGDYYHLKLPAEAINKTYHYSIRGKEWVLEDGELMFPERFTREVLDQKRRQLGAYNYAGQFLQEPAPLDGGEIKKDHLNYFYVKDFDPRTSNLYLTVDPAEGKEDAIKNDNDYTAMAVWALAPDQNMYLIDGLRERLNPTQRVDKLFELHQKWSGITGKPIKVGYEGINPSSDQHYIKKKQTQENYRFPITELPPKGQKRLSKIEKIRRLIPEFESGRIWLPHDISYKNEKGLPANFISDMIEQEFLLFPFAPHDDFLDAMSMIFDMPMKYPRAQKQESSRFNFGQDISVLDL